MKFDKNEIEKLEKEKESFLKPKIANNSICEFMITDVRFSDRAIENAKLEDRQLSFIYDSFTVRLAIVGYLKENKENPKAKPQWIKTISCETKDDVNILEPEMYLKSYVVLNKYFLKNHGIKEPNNETTAVLRYARAMELAWGVEYESAINLLIYIAKENNIPVTFADLGITSVKNPCWETICFYAYKRVKTKEKDGSIYTVITLYDKEKPIDPECKILDGEISTKAQELLLALAEENKKDSPDTPF